MVAALAKGQILQQAHSTAEAAWRRKQQLACRASLACAVVVVPRVPTRVLRCVRCPYASDAIRLAAASEDPAAVGMLQPATALLLQCVCLSGNALDLVVESQSIRWAVQSSALVWADHLHSKWLE